MKTLLGQMNLFSEAQFLNSTEPEITPAKETKATAAKKIKKAPLTSEEKKAQKLAFKKKVAEFQPHSNIFVLLTLPSGDGNYESALRRANKEELETALELFEQFPANNSGRISACKRRLKAIS